LLTATSGDAQVSLGWASVAGAVSYNVKRALASGGSYAFVANTTATSFTDTGLTNGTTYHYIVTALNAATESPSSAEVSATPLTALQQWRQSNFGTTNNTSDAADIADPDGDGWTNAQEFAAGTDPNDRASLLKVSQMETNGNDMTVSFTTVTGKTYRLERSASLQSGSWFPVQDSIPGTGGIVHVNDPNGAGQTKRFYRIVVAP
jgi:fibronectin type 3 domain-containing protein